MLKLLHVSPPNADEQLRILQVRGCTIHNLLTLPVSLDVAMTDALTGSADCKVMYGILYNDPDGVPLGHEPNSASRAVARLRECEDRAMRSELRRANDRIRTLERELASRSDDVKVEPPVM